MLSFELSYLQAILIGVLLYVVYVDFQTFRLARLGFFARYQGSLVEYAGLNGISVAMVMPFLLGHFLLLLASFNCYDPNSLRPSY
jgi:hypothetical protein